MPEYTEKEKAAMAAQMNKEHEQRSLESYGAEPDETAEMVRIREAAEAGEIEWDKMPIDFAYDEEAKKAKRSKSPRGLKADRGSPKRHNLEEKDLARELLPHVKKLIRHWEYRGTLSEPSKAFKEAENAIHRIAGQKTVFYTLTEQEKRDPWLLARRIACVSKTQKKSGYNQYAVCRAGVR